jgi:hypothetical protein
VGSEMCIRDRVVGVFVRVHGYIYVGGLWGADKVGYSLFTVEQIGFSAFWWGVGVEGVVVDCRLG